LQRIAESRYFVPATALLYLVLAGVLFIVTGTRTKGEIEIFLTQWMAKILWVDFLLILFGLLLCRRDIAAAFSKIGTAPIFPEEQPPPSGSWRRRLNTAGVWLALIVVAGFLLVTQVAPQTHRIYYDEDIYANMAQNIALTGQTGMANYATFEYGEYHINWLLYNKDPGGWPFLVSLAFQLFGVDEVFLFRIANLLYAGGILLVFFITRLIAGRDLAGLLAALIFALIPHNLIWSNTAAAEAPAAFFGGLVVLITLVWLRTRAPRHLFLLAVILPFACTLRMESGLLGLWALAALAIAKIGTAPNFDDPAAGPPRHPFATREFWALGLVAFAFFIPHLWHLWAVSGHSWGADGAKFSTFFLAKNLKTNGLYYLDNAAFPLLFTLLALAGLAAGGGRRKGPAGGSPGLVGPRLLMLLWFGLFWGIFLFFYAGSYRYGADVRFALLSFMPLAILAGIGGDKIIGTAPNFGSFASPRLPVATLLVLVLLFSWMKFVPLIRLVGQEAWGARYDHDHAREFVKRIPNRSIVLSHVPTMFLLWGQNAIQSYAGINNPDVIRDLMMRYDGHVYFHQGYWCSTLNDSNRLICEGIRKNYDLVPVATAREQTTEYGLFRMTKK